MEMHFQTITSKSQTSCLINCILSKKLHTQNEGQAESERQLAAESVQFS